MYIFMRHMAYRFHLIVVNYFKQKTNMRFVHFRWKMVFTRLVEGAPHQTAVFILRNFYWNEWIFVLCSRARARAERRCGECGCFVCRVRVVWFAGWQMQLNRSNHNRFAGGLKKLGKRGIGMQFIFGIHGQSRNKWHVNCNWQSRGGRLFYRVNHCIYIVFFYFVFVLLALFWYCQQKPKT